MCSKAPAPSGDSVPPSPSSAASLPPASTTTTPLSPTASGAPLTPPTPPTPMTPTPPPTSTSTSTPTPTAAAVPRVPAPAASPARIPPAAPVAAVTPPPPADPALVRQIVEMGFSADQARQALWAASNNLQAAVEFIMNDSIPRAPIAGVDGRNAAELLYAHGLGASVDMDDEEEEIELPEFDALAVSYNLLRHIPHFRAIAQAAERSEGRVQDFVAPLMAGLRETNPDLAVLIDDNPLVFVRMLYMCMMDEHQHVQEELSQLLVRLAREDEELVQLINTHPTEFVQLMQGTYQPPPGDVMDNAQVIRLTPEEHAVIRNIHQVYSSLSVQAVLRVFLSCGRNPERTASYIVDHFAEIQASSDAMGDDDLPDDEDDDDEDTLGDWAEH